MNISKCLVAASAVTMLCGAATAQGFDAQVLQLEGRTDVTVSADELPCSSDTNGASDCNVFWQNGGPDFRHAVRSAESPAHQWYAADDFILHPCRWNYLESVELYMAIGVDVVDPVVELRIYPDCDGKPDKSFAPEVYPGWICDGMESMTFPGYNIHKVRFQLDWWVFGNEDGCDRFWLNPVGLTANTKYFWISTDVGGQAPNSGQRDLQGVQAHFKAPTTVPPYLDWTPYDQYCPNPEFPDCAGACIDFNFQICGKVCALLKDQSDFDLDGYAATKFPNVNDTGMSADNFQVAPGGQFDQQGTVEICRIEAYMATNCNPDLVYGLIFHNDCDKPGDELYNLGFVDFWEPISIAENAGADFDGLPVYKFVWFCTGKDVRKGRNYWFAPLASRGVNINERSVWLFRERLENCKDIWITEGCYMNWNDTDPVWRDVSYYTPLNTPRDFAFKIWLVDDNANGSVPQGDPGVTFNAADIDRDGSVGLQDLQLLLFSFGATTP
ncbi:MAG: hypothetical protein KDA20_10300 [Phycisphaerales bacterium]|nr:hypothetical protein [Phycisphaerales bacterium]